jgi:membrane protease subunit HflC
MRILYAALAVVILLGAVALTCIYVVDEREQVVVTRFGKVVYEPRTQAGLAFKLPWEVANKIPKNLQDWDDLPEELPTEEKTYIWVDTLARWKIVDPVLFFQTVNNPVAARQRLSEIIGPSVRAAIASHRLIEVVRHSNREMEIIDEEFEGRDAAVHPRVNIGRVALMETIKANAGRQLSNFGIELVDVKIKRLNYKDDVRRSVYNRMIAERKQIAEKFRSEGKGEARSILGDKEKELQRIFSTARRQAEEIRGRADAEAANIYAAAYSKDPDFYEFLNTLTLYREALDKDATLVLSTDAELFRYFKQGR